MQAFREPEVGALYPVRMARSPVSAPDVQNQRPSLHVSLSRVGVTGVEKIIRINRDGSDGPGEFFSANLECFVDLGPEQKGAHMSRFEEVVNEAIGEVVLGEAAFGAESLAERIAVVVRERQGAQRAEVTVQARYPEHKPAPVSGILTQEIYTLYGSAVATEHGTRRMVGVAAAGMTACPCAQELVAATSRLRLAEEGFGEDEIERRLDAARAEVAIGPNWTLSGGIGYDFVTSTVISNYIGVAYECDCATMSIRYSESRSPGSTDVNRTILFGLQLRTLGDFDLSQRSQN